MGLKLLNTSAGIQESSPSDDLIRIISKFWNRNQWELYLKQFENPQSKEEMYVGTANDLEKFVAKKSVFGSAPFATVDGGIKFKGEESKPNLKRHFDR